MRSIERVVFASAALFTLSVAPVMAQRGGGGLHGGMMGGGLYGGFFRPGFHGAFSTRSRLPGGWGGPCDGLNGAGVTDLPSDSDEERRERKPYQAAYYAANREKVLAQRAAWRAANREKARERDRAYQAASREERRERKRAYRVANMEKVREKERSYRAANREKMRARHAAWRAANSEKVRAYNRAAYDRWRAQNGTGTDY